MEFREGRCVRQPYPFVERGCFLDLNVTSKEDNNVTVFQGLLSMKHCNL